MNYTHFVSVAGLISNDNGEILLINSPWRGWEYPGGMVEPGETFQEALIREIKEESGVEVEITGFIGLCKNVDKDIVNIDFSCKYIKGELTTSNESSEVKWVKKQDALEMITLPLTKKRLENMLSGIDKVNCFGFGIDPFEIIKEDTFNVGNR
ncbi:NUDIX hydrolase [Clostridium sp. AL.422]|uniref:NUDIX hydrolase n=1 Tax=Clostridium TaxID=1485 RepID=UPI00293DC01C|nr:MULTISPECIES: NUDIX hydrolase [unclassified Clostridium]MDV4151452.1 NUDIX hydrolase [Clostridium sp. AL.422]